MTQPTSSASRVAYVMSRFPTVTETFILREMDELERQGWEVGLFPLILEHPSVVHADALLWSDRARRAGPLSRAALRAHLHFLRRPRRLFSVWGGVLRGHVREPAVLVRALALLPVMVAMADEVERRGYRHVHAHFATYPLLAAWVAHRLTGVTYSVTVHAHDIFVSHAMLAEKLADARLIVTISQFNREYLLREIDPQLGPRIEVIHCGIESSVYRRQARQDLSDRLDLLCIGSLMPYKGQEFLLQACRILLDRGVPFRLRLVGDGPLRKDLTALAGALDLGDHVQFLGARSQEEVADLVAKSNVYVQPSILTTTGQMEGIPVALMEALAAELPPVSTALSGVPELIRPGQTGWLVPPEDPRALADALEEIRSDPAYAQRLAVQGRDLVRAEFDLRRNVHLLAAKFRELEASYAPD